MRRVLVLIMSLVPLAPAFADSGTREINGYNGVTVSFSKNAAKCNVTDDTVISDYLRAKLHDLGLKDNPNSFVHVAISVSGTTLGLLGAQCVTHTQVSFNARLRAENIITDNHAMRVILDRMGEFTVRLWTHSAFGVTTLPQPEEGGKSLAAYDAAREQIDLILARFAKEQKLAWRKWRRLNRKTNSSK